MERKTVTYGKGFLLADHTRKSTLPPNFKFLVSPPEISVNVPTVSGDCMQREVNFYITKHFYSVIYLEISNFTVVHGGIAGVT